MSANRLLNLPLTVKPAAAIAEVAAPTPPAPTPRSTPSNMTGGGREARGLTAGPTPTPKRTARGISGGATRIATSRLPMSTLT